MGDTDSIIPGGPLGPRLNRPMKVGPLATVREVLMASAILVLLLIMIILSIVIGTSRSKSEILGDYCNTPKCLAGSGYLMDNLNKSIDPCTDFFQYACGSYGKNNPLSPTTYSSTVYSKLLQRNQAKLNNILTRSALVKVGSWQYKLKLFYRTCVNDYENSKRGGKPLIDAINDAVGGWYLLDQYTPNIGSFDFNKALQKTHVDYWVNALFSYYVGQDYEDPVRRNIQIDLGGLGMYYKYYINDKDADIVQAYRNFIGNVTDLLLRDAGQKFGDDQQKQERIDGFVKDVVTFETQLAKITETSPVSENPHDYENRHTLGDLTADTKGSGIDWTAFFKYMFDQNRITSNTQVVLLEKYYMYNVSNYISTLGKDKNRILNNYLSWRLIQAYLPDLSYEYVHLGREFYVQRTGRTRFLGTWRYCFYYAANKMSDALGAMFVRDHFADQSKAKVHEMVNHIRTTIKNHLSSRTWMSQDTRERAEEKLDKVVDKLGYPDFMMDDAQLDSIYSSLTIVPSDYFQNVLNINKFEKVDWNRRLKEGVNKDEWRVATYDVAAKMSQLWVELIVPAGMLQLPLFDQSIPMYMNFGSMGSILAHELINAIDEIGGFYSKDGTFLDWWSKETETNYVKRRKCIVDFYDKKTYSARGTTFKVNGLSYSRTGVAETGGVRNAFWAYKDWEAKNGAEKLSPSLHLNNEQAFFVSYAQTNCYIRSEYYKWLQGQRGSVPEEIRTNGALQQLEEFQEVFNCKANRKMNPPNKCDVF